MFVRYVGCYELGIGLIAILTDNMQINGYSFCNCHTTSNKRSLLLRIVLNNGSIEDSFNHVAAIKSFFESTLDCMTFDQIVACSNSLTDDFNVHAI